MGTTYQQAGIPVGDPERFHAVLDSIQDSFASSGVDRFLGSVQRSGLRIREFEAVLRAGLLGKAAAGVYGELGDADQGQIREMYLHALERVSPELRDRYFKLYAYY